MIFCLTEIKCLSTLELLQTISNSLAGFSASPVSTDGPSSLVLISPFSLFPPSSSSSSSFSFSGDDCSRN